MNKKKTVLITGGTGSLGKNLIRYFREAGYDVKFQYNSNVTAANELKKEYCDIEAIQMDFMNNNNWEVFGKIDILINNAAFCNPEHVIDEIEDDIWERVMKVNLTTPFLLSKYVLHNMKKNRWGRIINIASTYGLKPMETLAPYSASKSGLIGFTKAIAKECASFGITCNSICPGTFDSDLMRNLGIEYCNKVGMKLDDYILELCEDIPMKRLAQLEDISKIALYLASEDAAYITGTAIPIDGGAIL